MGKKILIITMYSGENELCDCIDSVKGQNYSNYEHYIIANYPNLEAHRTLYNLINEQVRNYDYFIKIDADMVLLNSDVLVEIVEYFKNNKVVDHAVFSLFDGMSDQIIMGMHAFSSNVKWPQKDEYLFVDPNPLIPGKKAIEWNEPSPVARHSPNPSVRQAFFFGYQRALKLIQRDRLKKRVDQIDYQWALLNSIWHNLKIKKDKRIAASIYGAECAFRDGGKYLLEKQLQQTPDLSFLNDHVVEKFISKYAFWWEKKKMGYIFRYINHVLLPKFVRRVIKFRARTWKKIKGYNS